ncbi:MAG: Ger(x)C family spore germination protein [Bacillota bacterium]
MKKLICILLISILLLTLTGCWDIAEPEDRAMVIAFGSEYMPEEDKYRIYSQIINPLTMAGTSGAGGGGGNSQESSYWTVAGEGKTIIETLNNLRTKISRRFYYGHTQLEIYSQELAKTEGLAPILDAMERARQTRPIITPVITSGDMENIMTRPMPIESISGQGIHRQLEITNSEIGGTVQQTAEKFLNKLSTPGIEPVAAHVKNIEEEEEEEEEEKSPLLKATGLAAFRGDKLAGILNRKETRGYNWITNRVESTFLNITLPGYKEEQASIRASSRGGEIIPVIKDGKPAVRVLVSAQGLIENVTAHVHLKKESQLQESLNRRMAQAVKNDIKSGIEKAKELKSDIFGFGRSFYHNHYPLWKELDDDWEEEFVNLPVEIEVKADIKEIGLINKPITPH